MKLNQLLSIVLLPAALCAQESHLSVSLASWNGMKIEFVTKVEPPGSGADRLPGGVVTGQDRAHHMITDTPNRRYFGYDLRLEPLDSETARLLIEPLTLPSGGNIGLGIDAGWTLLAPSKFPVPPVMHVGDTFAFTLLVNPATGQKVVDYLSLRRGAEVSAQPSKTPVDFGVDDIELKLLHARVWVNGKLVGESGGVTANVLWLYLAGPGGFVISLRPDPSLGFQKAGVLSANTLTFHDGSSDYRVECDCQIAPGSGLYNVYVAHDSGKVYQAPRGREEPLIIGGATKPEYLIRKRQ